MKRTYLRVSEVLRYRLEPPVEVPPGDHTLVVENGKALLDGKPVAEAFREDILHRCDGEIKDAGTRVLAGGILRADVDRRCLKKASYMDRSEKKFYCYVHRTKESVKLDGT